VTTNPHEPPIPDHPRIGPPVLAANWVYVLFLGAMIAGLFAYAFDAVFPATRDDLVPTFALIAVVGLVGSLILATGSTIQLWRQADGLAGRLPWRQWGVWAAVAATCVVGLWGVAKIADRNRYSRVSTNIVGTWNASTFETTFYPDGTYESVSRTGPEKERVKDRGTYEISPDGVYINCYGPNNPRDDNPSWHYRIVFTGRNHFRTEERGLIHQGGIAYERVK
jgi:hypothetical protein